MIRRAAAALAVALLAGCGAVENVDDRITSLPATAPIPMEEAAVAGQPLPGAVEAASDTLQSAVSGAIDALDGLTPNAGPAAPLRPAQAACRRAASSLIVRWEVSSPAWYVRNLQHPIWPGGASGITWGIGYDGGHQSSRVIGEDWSSHGHRDRLSRTAGITGSRAKAILPEYRDIPTPLDHASRVFEERSLVEYERRTRRAFSDGFDALRPGACAALVSVVYNRGASVVGDSRREMKTIRDDCVPKQDYACISRELRSMKRLWINTVNERGLSARREAEAVLTETL